jgi:hypothetical protein
MSQRLRMKASTGKEFAGGMIQEVDDHALGARR